MNLSIYIKLRIANTFGKVKIKPKYKHLNYMIDNKLVARIGEQHVGDDGWPVYSQSNHFAITTDGKRAMWNENKHFVTRIISILALVISFLSLLFNYLS